MITLNCFQNQLDKLRIATIKHDLAYDDEMSETFAEFKKEYNKVKLMMKELEELLEGQL